MIDRRIFEFMAKYRAERVCYVNPELVMGETSSEIEGFELQSNTQVNGLVVWGKEYPLACWDLPVEEHLRIYDAILSVRPVGVLALVNDRPYYLLASEFRARHS